MTRDTQIPLFLWVATAVVAHLLWGGGADQVAQVVSERIEVAEFAASVRRFVRGEQNRVEVALIDDTSATDKPDPTAPEEQKVEPAPPDEKGAEKDEAPPDPKDAKKEDVRPEEKKKPPEPPKPKEEEKKKEEPVPVEEKPVKELPPPEHQKRVAVKQHVKDPNQADNPNANFLGDQANHVKEETQARITSTQQDDPKPTPGGAAVASGDPSDPGNADKTVVAQNEDRPGEKTAPGEEPAASELRLTPAPAAAAAEGGQKSDEAQLGPRVASRTEPQAARQPPQAGAEAKPTLKAAEAMPDALDSSKGAWEVAGERAASIEQQGRPAKKKRSLPPLRSTSPTDLLGLGGTGKSPGGVNLNLSPEVAVAAIGRDTLKREIRADGERRRSQHAGRWRPVGVERWRAAIENYVASVKPGNQTALNTARAPFASYLQQIHIRLHPIFAETFLDSLDDLPSSHPMNRPGITTNLEIVLDPNEGRIQKMGVTKTSGVTAFDVAALESVHRAQPFGTPPSEIVSPDGNVYFHWEFHRNREEACSTYFARPFILKGQPKSAPPPAPKPEAPPDSEAPNRHGSLPRPRTPVALAHAER